MTITERELNSIRMAQEAFMPERITRRRPVEIAEDEEGHDEEKGIRARITPGFGFFRDVADRMVGITAFTITVPWDKDIRVNDELIDEKNGEVFEVRDVRDNKAYQTALQILGDRVGRDSDGTR